jgi:hypothetical protein
MYVTLILQVDYPDVVKIKKSLIKSEPSLYNAIGTENKDLEVEGELK